LVWAHAEYVKLRRSLRDGQVFDQPPQTVQRYQIEKQRATHFPWRFNNKPRTMPCGKILRIVTMSLARLRWSFDSWATTGDSLTRDTGLGVQIIDLPSTQLPVGRQIVFTFFWPEANNWEGRDFTVFVE
jgi:glucoamylase